MLRILRDLLTTKVYWSESGELVTLACEDAFYVLRFSRENFVAALQSGEIEEDGVEAAFETITDINERQVLRSLKACRD